jgi:hypothetical protein
MYPAQVKPLPCTEARPFTRNAFITTKPEVTLG